MDISVFGLGYVGCVSAACLAHEDHTVLGVDINPLKVELLGSGRTPVVEPGLDEIVREVVASDKLRVCLDGKAAVHRSEVSLICVGTPSNENGSLKLQCVENVCREIGAALATKQGYHVVVVRSTVLPGTVEERLIPLLEEHSGRRAGIDFGVCMNPEFLREGSAIHDYYHPSFVVIGELDLRSGNVVQAMYESVDAPVIRTALPTAEMVKYASNAFHALKVVFANEIGNICKAHGIDGQQVMEIFGEDRQLNVSTAYLKPGFAFGGSCLPKDLRALLYRAKELDVDCSLLNAILPSNQKQVEIGIKLVEKTKRKKVGIVGLSFKPDTDDLRESPAIILAETLLGRGYQVRIFDDKVELSRLVGANKSFLEQELPHIASLMCSSIEQLVAQSEVVVVTHGSKAFEQVPRLLNGHQALIDLVGVAKNNSDRQNAYEGICW
jgi:GDP-mannose 6-dehydrogenase